MKRQHDDTWTAGLSKGKLLLFLSVEPLSRFELAGALCYTRVAVKRRAQGRLERGVAADLWKHTLSQIPSIFGRLAYLASLRDSNTGRYEHHGLALVYGEEESHKTLLASHEKAFADWLSFDLENQKADLHLYFAGLTNNPSMIVGHWNTLDFHKYLVPSTASPTQRDLYAVDLQAVLQLFIGSSSRRDA